MHRRYWALIGLLSFCGCSVVADPQADLGALYDRAASDHGPHRNPIIVIPGILGSKLVDEPSARVVWGAFRGDFADPGQPDGARLISLPLREIVDAVRPAGALDRLDLDLIGLPISVSAYRNILATLGVGGYADETFGELGTIDYGSDHYTCFQFDYDWRLDNVVNARRLYDFIVEKRRYVQEEHRKRFGTIDADVKFDIVAHSMGGLVTRYFLRYGREALPQEGPVPAPTWAGARFVERVVLVATPNAGSILSLQDLLEGEQLAPMTPRYHATILGTMPSVYQLLPRGRHRVLINAENREPIDDLYDPALWEEMGWGLADPRNEEMLAILLPDEPDPRRRREIAQLRLATSLEQARRFAAALDQPAAPPPGVDLFLFAGDAVSTPATATWNPGHRKLRFTEYRPGDGTVLRSSALMDERADGAWSPYLRSPIAWKQTTFLFRDHLGITQEPEFNDNLLYLLLEAPRDAGRLHR